MTRKTPVITTALAMLAVIVLTGAKGCGNVSPGSSVGSSVVVGDIALPVRAVPAGIDGTGATVWMKAGLAGAISGATLAEALKMVGGTAQAAVSRSSPKDPCAGKNSQTKVEGWLSGRGKFFINCGTWRKIKGQGKLRSRDLPTVFKCIENLLNGAFRIATYGTVYYSIFSGSRASLLTQDAGNGEEQITSVTVDNWADCAAG